MSFEGITAHPVLRIEGYSRLILPDKEFVRQNMHAEYIILLFTQRCTFRSSNCRMQNLGPSHICHLWDSLSIEGVPPPQKKSNFAWLSSSCYGNSSVAMTATEFSLRDISYSNRLENHLPRARRYNFVHSQLLFECVFLP